MYGHKSRATIEKEGFYTNWVEFVVLFNIETNWSKKEEKSSFNFKAKISEGNKNKGAINQGKSDSQPIKYRDIKCFKCFGISHIASQYPNKRLMILKYDGEIKIEGKSDDEYMLGGCK